ncbi:MAG: CoA-binding protein, partial [Proteobacteria bacterium]|nr:CoA-binding protein [Pseudomonadota bacterium]
EPGEVDWIELFLNPTRLMPLVDEIIRLSPKLVWCQLGVINEEFNQKMKEANIPYIVDYCPRRDWNQ